MMGLQLSPRSRIILVVVLLLGLILFMPMRIALGLTGLERVGLAAREVQGTLWSGRIDQLMLGTMPVGSVRAALSPISLAIADVVTAHLCRPACAPPLPCGARPPPLRARQSRAEDCRRIA